MSDPPLGGPGGELVLVATPIGNLRDLSPRAASVLSSADIVCCEDTRHTGVMLKRLGIRARRLLSLHAHNEVARTPALLEELRAGRTVALVTDAGTPAISDPGERLVAAAAAAGLRVSIVPGPSAALAAVVLSGMPVGRWRFEGFLPRRGAERRRRLADIASSPSPSVCYESPQRLATTLAELAEACGPGRRVAVCRELTKIHEEVRRSSLGEAARAAGASEPRGEHVLVVGGTGDADGEEAQGTGTGREGQLPSDEAMAGAVAELVAAGATRRDAVREVADALGVSRRLVYAAALGPSGSPGGGPSDR